MTSIRWEIKKFCELTPGELYQILRLRVDVFVVEQACPYPELDGKDTHADTLHVSLHTADGYLAAYLRILAPGVTYAGVTIGRVVTAMGFRGRGLSHALMEKAIEHSQENWPGIPLHMGAQSYLKAFYESHGFEAISEIYFEDGIPHITMVRQSS